MAKLYNAMPGLTKNINRCATLTAGEERVTSAAMSGESSPAFKARFVRNGSCYVSDLYIDKVANLTSRSFEPQDDKEEQVKNINKT
jgi:hypothetical protein